MQRSEWPMTNRQVSLIAQLVVACWNQQEKAAAAVLLELLGPQVHQEIADRIRAALKPN